MYQAIETRYVGPTNSRGSRIIARAAAGRLTVHWDYVLNPEMNHQRAADLLARKLGWVGEHHGILIGGGNASNTGYVFVFANTSHIDWETRAFSGQTEHAA